MVLRFTLSAGLRLILRNAAAILAADAVNRGTTFVLYTLVARYLGTFEFGQLALALALFYTFQMLAAAGLKTLIIREVARDRARSSLYLINGAVILVATTLLSLASLFVFVTLMGYSRSTASLILLLALGLVPVAFTTLFEALFQAWERMHFIAIANIPASILKASVAFVVLARGGRLFTLAVVILLTQAAVAAVEWQFLTRYVVRAHARIDLRWSLRMLRASAPFLGIDVTNAAYSSIQIVLLSVLAGETDVGLYGAASQVLVPIGLLFQSLTQTLFPVMCRRFEVDCRELKQLAERALVWLLAAAIPASLVLFIFADRVLALLYGAHKFHGAAPVLRILVWSLIFTATTHALGQVLLAGRREVITLRIVAVNAVVSLTLGLVLIERLGPLRGAPLAMLVAGFVNVVQHYVPVSRLVGGILPSRLMVTSAFSPLSLDGSSRGDSDARGIN
ncbi:MAG TPA: flippase [Vicinamibacterales bacterium]|jgi:O-antigen/teichoic acid export membrane protein